MLRVALLLATGGLLAYGVWSAAPALLQTVIALPTAAPDATPRPLPTAVASAIGAVQSAITRAQQSGGAVAVSLAVTEQDLTRTAATYFPQTYAGVTVSSPSVRVASGQVVLTATARSFIGSGPLVATATPYASNGKLLIRIESASVAGVGLPDAIRAQLTQQLQAAVDSQVMPHLQVTGVTAQSGTLSLTGTALP